MVYDDISWTPNSNLTEAVIVSQVGCAAEFGAAFYYSAGKKGFVIGSWA